MSAESHEDDIPIRKFDLAMWKRIYVFARPYGRYIALLLFFAVLVAGFDAAIPHFNGSVIDAVARKAPREEVRREFVKYAITMFCFAISIWSFIMTAGRISVGFAYDLRKEAFRHLQELSF